MPGTERNRRPMVLAATALALLVCAVFFPILSFDFVDLDVEDQIVQNRYIQGLTAENLWHILTSRCTTSYYPVRTLTFALDYQLWGLRPVGFALTNVLLHLANVLLLFWLILRLFGHHDFTYTPPHHLVPSRRPSHEGTERLVGASSEEGGASMEPSAEWKGIWRVLAAALGAGLFAVHPVVAEPVAWTCGREELLMVFGALTCMHLHFAARLREASGRGRRTSWRLHGGAAVACAAACLSNVVGAVIPLLVVAMDLLWRPRPSWGRVLTAAAPLVAIAAATAVVKKLDPQASQMIDPEAPIFSAAWLMLVLNVYWLNLSSLAWPVRLACDYGRVFPGSFSNPEVILGGFAVAATLGALWMLRRRRLALFGLMWFLLALAPTSQVMPYHVHRADRFLYLPLCGLAILGATALLPLGQRLKSRAAVAWAVALGLLVLLPLGVRTIFQIQTWQNSLALWENCAGVAPNYAIARRALADQLVRAGQFEAARRQYEASMDLEPNRVETMVNLAGLLGTCQRPELRDYPLAVRLAERALELSQGRDPRVRRALAAIYTEVGTDRLLRHQMADALECYRSAVDMDPDYAMARFRLADMLAACPDEKLRNPAEAVRQAEEACRLTGQPGAHQRAILAESYAAAKRYDDAAAQIEKAIRLPEVQGNAQLAFELQRLWSRYRQLGWNTGTASP